MIASPKRGRGWRSIVAPYLEIHSAVRRYLLGSFFTGVGWAVFMLLLNLYLKELGYAESFIGRLWSVQSLGMIVMVFPAAAMVARFSARWLVTCAAILAAISYMVLAVANLAVVMIAASAGVGMMMSLPRVTAAPFFMKHTTSVERSHVFSLQFASMLGAGLFAYFGGGWAHRQLAATLDSQIMAYRVLLLIGASACLASAACYAGIPSGIVIDRSQTTASLMQRAKSKGPLLFRLTFPFFIVGLGAGLVIPFLNLYFRDRFGMQPMAIGIYYGLVQSSMLLGVLLGPYLARRWGMIRVVVYTELASLPFMVLLAFSYSLPVSVAAFVIRGALMNMGIPIANNYLMERVGASDRAVANGLGMLAWTSSWALATWIGGQLIEHIGYTEPLLAAAGLYFTSSVLYFWFFHNQEIYAGRESAPQRDGW